MNPDQQLADYAVSGDLAEDVWLLGDEAARWLREVAEAEVPLHRMATRLRKELSSERARRVLELAELRRRAGVKFLAAGEMFFTRVGLEQATDQWVATHKAKRFERFNDVADLCSGIGGDTAALGMVSGRMFACDHSPLALEFARRNVLAMVGDAAAAVQFVLADAERFDLSTVRAWHLDPDRRPRGRRTTHAALHEPSDEAIDRMLDANPHGAIKLAPACEVPAHCASGGELEWISRDGECRQLVVWHGNLAHQPGWRRATLLASTGNRQPVVVRTLSGNVLPPPFDDGIDRYIYEPDPAVLASELVGQLAKEHGWWMFSSTSGYLTGPRLVEEPACSRFEVQDVLPLNLKKLAAYLRERNVGRVEIKHRAVDVQPNALRKSLKLQGDQLAILLITRMAEKRIAIVAERARASGIPAQAGTQTHGVATGFPPPRERLIS